jgi:hypothetical protein
MNAKLHSLTFLDIEAIKYYDPANPVFNFHVQAFVGPMNAPGEDSFEFQCCSPAWLQNTLENDVSFILGRHMIIMKEFSEEELFSIIAFLCVNTTGDSWNEIGEKLGRHGFWEFEDYK